MDRLPHPQALNFSQENLAQGWKKWKNEFNFFMQATESDNKANKVKSSILLTCIGSKGREIYSTFTFENDEAKMDLSTILNNFDAYCEPRKNITYIRHKFFTCKQEERQCFADYVTHLKQKAADCEFGTLEESLIKDILICGIIDNKLRDRLLRLPTVTLKEVIEHGLASEEIKKHSDEFNKEQTIGAISQKSRDATKSYNNNYNSNRNTINNCRYCGGSHRRGNCPAYHKMCSKCQRKGHFSNCCLSQQRKIQEIETQYNNPESEPLFLGMIKTSDTSNEIKCESKQSQDGQSIDAINSNNDELKWEAMMDTNGSLVSYKLDTGAQTNVMPQHIFNSLEHKPKILPTNIKLTAYNDTAIPVVGKCIATVTHNRSKSPVLFIIADTNSSAVLGSSTCDKLGLIRRIYKVDAESSKIDRPKEYYTQKYRNCFDDLGTLPGLQHITTDKNVPPVVHSPRKIPFSLIDNLKVELKRMESLGVIVPVTEPTEWVSSLVMTEKPNGKLRICLDPRDLNRAILREHFKLPTAEEIFAKMHGARYFTKLDASSGYWQVKVDDESSKLLTFNTPFGRYRYTRLPFGIHSASEIFQQKVSHILEGLEGVENSQDDIIIWSTTLEQHYERLERVLSVIKSSGMKLNKSKCTFVSTEITFLGHLITSEGIKADPSKVTAINQMPIPECKEDLQRFLGMTNYLCKFIPNYSDITTPLRTLLEKDVIWNFEHHQQDAVDKLKAIITSNQVLQFYNPCLPLKLTADASKSGLGAILEQNHDGSWLPVAFTSRALSKTEQNYSQIEKETLSILFGCEKFDELIYGHKFLVINDHKPLKNIFTKALYRTPPRIQRFLLRLQRYDFTMEYAPGKTVVVADALSRSYISDDTPEISEEEMKCHVHSIVEALPMSKHKLYQYQEETLKDEVLKVVTTYVKEGWPDKRSINYLVLPYYPVRDEITNVQGILFKSDRLIVPSSLKGEALTCIHTGHQGTNNCLLKARGSVYWPGMTNQIKQITSACSWCLDYRNKQKKEPLLQHEIPEIPWSKVGTDVLHIYGKSYVIVVDYTTKFFDIQSIPDCESPTVISRIKSTFAKFGIPYEVFSDNGPEYTAKDFVDFAKKWDFIHDNSSPFFPQSNGMVERCIQTVKRTIKKALDSSEDPYLALLALRTTPGQDGLSPAFRLMNRTVRNNMPYQKGNQIVIRHNKESFCERKNQICKSLPDLLPGDLVRIQDKFNWKSKGVVMAKSSYPRSYIVKNEKGSKIRRNRRHLLKSNEKQNDLEEEYDVLYENGNNELQNAAEHNEEQQNEEPQDDNTGSDDGDNHNQEITTRSGRVVRPPIRFQNYVP